MNHLKWLGHASTLLDMQKTLQNSSELCDVKLICGNGKIMCAHKAVLFSSSDFFRTILKNITDTAEICTILLPDVKDNILSDILDFIYTGSISLAAINLSEFLEDINMLGIKSAISFECNATNKGKILKPEDSIIFENAVIQEDTDENMEREHVIEQEEEEEEEEEQEIDTIDSSIDTEDPKSIQYLEVFNAGDSKMGQYAIQSNTIEENATGDYILTENPDNTFTLTEQKIQVNKSAKSLESQSDISNTSAVHGIKIATVTSIKSGNNKTKYEKIDSPNIGLNQLTIGRHTGPITSQGRAQAFEDAVQAVINEGISLQKAAHKFNVSKTVLWRRVKKNPAYNKTCRENPIIEAAIQKLEQGESLKSVSQALDIPMSTLHRHKVRLADEGRLPEHIQIKRRDLESKQNLKIKLGKAVEACINGMSQNHAAVVYEVPKSTLWRHLQRRSLNLKATVDVKNEPTEENVDGKVVKTEETEDIAIEPFSN